MKFAKKLESESVPEWRNAYLDYKRLKKVLKKVDKALKAQEKELAFNHGNIHKTHSPNQSMLPSHSSQVPNSHSGWISSLFPSISKIFVRQNSMGIKPHRSRPDVVDFSEGAGISMLENVLDEEKEFFQVLDAQLEKVTSFYDAKEIEAGQKLQALKEQIRVCSENTPSHRNRNSIGQAVLTALEDMQSPRTVKNTNHSDIVTGISTETDPQHMDFKEAKDRIKRFTTEFYRSLDILKTYRILNREGFVKILKKFDKTAGWTASDTYLTKVDQQPFVNSRKLDAIFTETEQLYIDNFAAGQRRKAMNKLRIPHDPQTYHSAAWRAGLYIGMALPVLLEALASIWHGQNMNLQPNQVIYLQIYGAFLLPVLFTMGVGINMIVWSHYRINYKFIFEFDPRNNLDYHQFIELAAIFFLILSYCVYFNFMNTFAPTIQPSAWPMIFFVTSLAILFCPFRILYFPARRWFIIAIGRIVLSSLFRIEFRDFFLGDELNSMGYSFQSLGWLICVYSHNWSDLSVNCPLLTLWATVFLSILPSWWRALQCVRRYYDSKEAFPHLVNAGKYASNLLALVIFGTNRIRGGTLLKEVYVVGVIYSTYTSSWDVMMDWGLLRIKAKHFLLRDDIVFAKPVYYLAIVSDILLRFLWLINYMKLPLDSRLVAFIVAAGEAYRRFQWNFIRMENEHLNNVGHFRAIREIPLPYPVRDQNEEIDRSSPTWPTRNDAVAKAGKFYDRRDFENKRDTDGDNDANGQPKRTFSMSTVLKHGITMRKDSDSSEHEDGSGPHK